MAEPITNVLGTVAIKHCGEYDATMHYEKLNVVTYNGSSYCAKDNTIGNLPTNTTYWDLMAEKGSKGDTGNAGYTPVKGTDYYTAADKADLESTLSSDVSDEVSTQLEDLTSATPLVASSTAGMTDTTRIYVNTSDGHWYWYNGSAWTDGGTYQSTGISLQSVNNKMSTFIGKVENNLYNLAPKRETVNGVTLTVDEFGKCTLNGTASAYTTIRIELINFVNLTEAKYFSTKNCPNNYSKFSQLLYGTNADNDTVELVNGVNGDWNEYYYTFPAKTWVDNSFYLAVSFTGSTVFDNVVFYPALFPGNYKDNVDDWGITLKNSAYMTKKEIQDYVKENTNMLPLRFTPKQLFNYKSNTLVTGKFIKSNNGTEATNQYYCYDIIPIDYRKEYLVKNDVTQIAFFDNNMRYISGADTQGSVSTPIAIPSHAYYASISVPISTKANIMVEYGQTQHTYENYIDNMGLGEILNGYSFSDVAGLYYQKISTIMKKLYDDSTETHIKFLGDSITAGVGGTGYSPTGETIMTDSGSNVYKANETGKCWANMMKDYLEEKFNCEVKNWGVSGKNTYWLQAYKDQLVTNDDEIIIICFGTNDRVNDDNTYANIKTFVDYAENLGKQVIVMSNIPATNNDEISRTIHMEDIEHRICHYCSDTNREYISIFKLMNEYLRYTNTSLESILGDGLHPNDTGYEIMFYLICNSLGIGTKIEGALW